jgi:hydroxymethylpyrimidine/phosphomethylpyrimidine kinase
MGQRPNILSIAGFDPTSGAGVTADVKTAAAMDCYAVSCITALTVQSTQGVFQVIPVSPEVVRETLHRLAEDVEIAAVRIGMLGAAEVAKVVAKFFHQHPHPNLVVDPVLRASSGAALIDEEGVETIRKLMPHCRIVTPNWQEAIELAGFTHEEIPLPKSWEAALPNLRTIAAEIHNFGAEAVVITGGHLPESNDYLSLLEVGGTVEQVFAGGRLDSKATHGTGCAFATALACELAHGKPLPLAVAGAKEYVRKAIRSAYPVGKGHGPMNHLFRMDQCEH